MNHTVHETLEKDDPWKRLFIMVLFLIINSVLKGIILLTAAVQFLHVLFKGETQATVLKFGAGLSNYSYDIASYLTYQTDDKPFPFSDWDSGDR